MCFGEVCFIVSLCLQDKLEVEELSRGLKVRSDKPHLVSLGGGRLSTAVTLLPLDEGKFTVYNLKGQGWERDKNRDRMGWDGTETGRKQWARWFDLRRYACPHQANCLQLCENHLENTVLKYWFHCISDFVNSLNCRKPQQLFIRNQQCRISKKAIKAVIV